MHYSVAFLVANYIHVLQLPETVCYITIQNSYLVYILRLCVTMFPYCLLVADSRTPQAYTPHVYKDKVWLIVL